MVLQNNCLRLCTGALKSTPVSVLQITNKEQPLELRRLELQVKFLYKILKDNIFIQNTTDCWKNHYGNQNINKQALMKRIVNIIPIQPLETFYDDYKIQTKVFPIPIWHIPDIQVNLELVNKIDKISNPSRGKLFFFNYNKKSAAGLNTQARCHYSNRILVLIVSQFFFLASQSFLL